MFTLYWIPRPGDPLPRFVAHLDTGARFVVKGVKVKDHEGALEFRFPENEYNRRRILNPHIPWHLELPKKVYRDAKRTSPKAESNADSLPVSEPVLQNPIDRAELIEILVNNGISFKKNEKSSTLFEKLPDDIARNFKLVKSKFEVQTQ